jgi:hypothetical protein
LSEDQKVLAKLKEKKDSTYNALLEKVILAKRFPFLNWIVSN